MTGEGKVIALTADSEQIVIEHGEIQNFMDAMTMGYKVSSRALLEGIKAGDKIRFTLDTDKRSITKIMKVK